MLILASSDTGPRFLDITILIDTSASILPHPNKICPYMLQYEHWIPSGCIVDIHLHLSPYVVPTQIQPGRYAPYVLNDDYIFV